MSSLPPVNFGDTDPLLEERGEAGDGASDSPLHCHWRHCVRPPKWAHVKRSVWRVLNEVALYQNEITGSRRKRAMLRREQKKVSWIKDLVPKCTKGEDLVTDFCADTCLKSRAYMLPGQY